ncbi:MAG TPA: DNA-binding protein [Cytophagales bacterium]|jgi:Fic family protein|nr:DNA-binding protein [Cytophagales bacterium]
MTFADAITAKRKELGYTILKVSMLSGIDQALLSKYENNQRLPSEPHVKFLAESLKMDYVELRKLYLAEKIYSLLEYETNPLEILQAAEDRVEYLKSRNVFSQTELTKNVQDKLSLADKLKSNWQEKKPLNQTQLQKMKGYFAIKYTYDSNRIEGNTLTLQETQLVVNEGVTIGGKSMREHLEAINHSEAVDFVADMLVGKEDISQRNLLEIHRLVLKSIDNENAGKYRNVPVRISGSEHMPPQPFLIEKMMEDFFIYYERQKRVLHPILLAAEMHERLVTIHPFVDGNGRTSRLLMNFILLKNGYTLTILKGDPSSKTAYFKSLEAVQTRNDSNQFYDLITDRVIASLEEHLELV